MSTIRGKNIIEKICLFVVATVASTVSLVLIGSALCKPIFAAQLQAPELGRYGMTPIYAQDVKDGVYDISVESNSKFFKINKAVLTVEDGEMSADITIGSHSYLYVFMGVRKDAESAGERAWITPVEDGDNYIFHIPVEALDKPIDCAAYSKRKKKWYDRQLLFDATSLQEDALKIELPDYDAIEQGLQLLGEGGTDYDAQVDSEELLGAVEVPYEDGEYSIDVSMTGGTGRVAISSPTLLIVKDGLAYAKILWSSSHYDYMIVGGQKYLNENRDGGNSYFIIPIPEMDTVIPVIADTTAMEEPVEIEYSLTFYEDTIGNKGQIPQEAAKKVLLVALIIVAVGGIFELLRSRRKG